MTASSYSSIASPTENLEHNSSHAGEGWALLASRTLLFALFQAAFALIFWLMGRPDPWDESIEWWIYAATFTNLISLRLLVALLRREGKTLWDLYRPDRERVLRDVLWTLGAMTVGSLLVMLPNLWLGAVLFGDPRIPSEVMFGPLPRVFVIVAMVAFPITIGLAELPTYFGYLLPRFRGSTGKVWIAVLITGVALAFQHVALPLVFDPRFMLWRFLMFLPFALYTGAILAWKPRLLLYFMIVHALLDLMTAIMFLP